MLVLLSKVPESADDWNTFSFVLRDEVRRCNEAILVRFNTELPEYQLDPLNFSHVEEWLTNVSQAIGAINSILGTQSTDLFNVNLADQSAKVGWVHAVFEELFTAESVLQI